jgi:hypothetical protein
MPPKRTWTKKIRPIRVEGDTAIVPLTRGFEAVIDAVDVPIVEGWNWVAIPGGKIGMPTVAAIARSDCISFSYLYLRGT